MRQGWRVSAPEQLAAVQRRCRADLAWLPSATRALRDPVPVRISDELKAFQDQVTRDLRRRIAVHVREEPPDCRPGLRCTGLGA